MRPFRPRLTRHDVALGLLAVPVFLLFYAAPLLTVCCVLSKYGLGVVGAVVFLLSGVVIGVTSRTDGRQFAAGVLFVYTAVFILILGVAVGLIGGYVLLR